jgi:hypothetical protein
MALSTRFSSTCFRRSGSPLKGCARQRGGQVDLQRQALVGGAVAGQLARLCITLPSAKSVLQRHALGLDLGQVEHVVDQPQQVLRRLVGLAELVAQHRVLGALRARPVMPMMALIGVRSSWLMLARKLLLARLAASAASLAIDSAAVRSSTSSSRWCGGAASSASPACGG